MAGNDNLRVNGYHFSTPKDAQDAWQDRKKAVYFEEKTEGRNSHALLAIYNKLLDEKIFRTPVGWEYLRRIQEQLKEEGISEEEMHPIPIETSFSYHAKEESKSISIREKERKTARRLRISVVFNILLCIMVIAMFVITLQSDNPNILNYEREVIDEYASWEQELTERENQIRDKEQELQMESDELDERGE